MTDTFTSFDKKVEELATLRKPRIAFGLLKPDQVILESLERSKRYADICLVGSSEISEIKSFEVITSENPEEKLANLLVSGSVEGIVRGTVDDLKTREIYSKLTGETLGGDFSLLQDSVGHRFFFGPASNPNGWSKEDRLSLAEEFASFCHEWNISPKVALLAGTRTDTYERKKETREGVVGLLNQTYEDAEWLTGELIKKDIDAKNWSIDSDRAIQDGCNIIIAPNGMVGNQMFRMLLLTGGKILFCNHIGVSYNYEDNSRNEKDFDYHIKWLVALINKRNESTN